MKDFLARHEYLVVWVLALVIMGSLAYAILQLNAYVPTTPATLPGQSPAGAGGVQPPAIPPAPSVTFFIQKAPKNATSGNAFIIQWQNLPNGTIALNILRSQTGTNDWSLWKTVTITADELGSGMANIDIGAATEAGYSFEVEAVSGGGQTTDIGNSTSTSGETVLWTSSSTIPVVTTSTPPVAPPENPPAENPTSTSSSTDQSSDGNQNQSSSTSQSSSTAGSDNGTASQTPSGIPYYNPQVQITAYGTAPGSFWVSHVNQSIEIGWQDIPANVDTITVARSASSTGPWSTIIIQHNPGTSGSYSLQLVDNTIGDPYYYEMIALQGTTTIATYGPAYLDPNN